jgi:hypothetical protein
MPEQAVEQQTPWAQKFELHSASVVQAAPFGFLPQLPLMQVLGARHSAFVVHGIIPQLVALAHA